MTVKRGQAPSKIPVTLSFTGAAEKFQLPVVYVNRKQSDLRAMMDDGKSAAELVLYVLNSWDTDYPLTVDGINEIDEDHPGIAEGIVIGLWQSRRVSLEKN